MNEKVMRMKDFYPTSKKFVPIDCSRCDNTSMTPRSGILRCNMAGRPKCLRESHERDFYFRNAKILPDRILSKCHYHVLMPDDEEYDLDDWAFIQEVCRDIPRLFAWRSRRSR